MGVLPQHCSTRRMYHNKGLFPGNDFEISDSQSGSAKMRAQKNKEMIL